MSYMNDVGVVMKGVAWNTFVDDIVANQEIEFDEDLFFNRQRFLNNVKVIKRDDNVILLWHYQKWDEATDEIVERFIDYCRSLDTPVKYIRIGEGAESVDDIEDHWWNGMDSDMNLIRVNRSARIWLTGKSFY